MKPIARAESELLDLVLNHDGTVTGLMTPECAGWLLKLNSGNRPVLESDVRKFEGILSRGEWMNTGEPVIISREGVVNDGQHRLEAIFRACRAAEMDVRFGIARAAFTATGTGRVRTAADVLSIAGETNTARLASILRLVDGYRRSALLRPDMLKLTPRQTMELLPRHPFTRDAARLVSSFRTRGAATAPFGAVLVLAAEETDGETATRFAQLVETGTADRGDGSRELRERMLSDAGGRVTVDQLSRMILAINGWNAWIEGRQVTHLKVLESHRTTQGFPRVSGRMKPRYRVAAA